MEREGAARGSDRSIIYEGGVELRTPVRTSHEWRRVREVDSIRFWKWKCQVKGSKSLIE